MGQAECGKKLTVLSHTVYTTVFSSPRANSSLLGCHFSSVLLPPTNMKRTFDQYAAGEERIEAERDSNAIEDESESQKRCTKCNELKSVEQYVKDRNRKDGLSVWCKMCVSEYQRGNRQKLARSSDNIPTRTTKRCPKCRLVKPCEEFCRNRSNKGGSSSQCKPCLYAKQHSVRQTVRGALMVLLNAARASAVHRRAKGRESSGYCFLTIEDLLALYDSQDGYCHYFPSKKMSLVSGMTWHISLERLNPSGNYENGNVVLCCEEFNVTSQWKALKIAVMVCLLQSATQSFNSASFYSSIYDYQRKTTSTRCDRPEHTRKYKRGACVSCQQVTDSLRRSLPRGFILIMLAGMRNRSKKWGLECEFDLESMVQLIIRQCGRCHISGLPLVFCTNANWKCSPERINPRYGYTMDNVVLICCEFQSASNRVEYTGVADDDVAGLGAQWTPSKFEEWKTCLLSQE